MNGWIDKKMMVGRQKKFDEKIDAWFDGYIIFNGWIEKN